MPFLIVAFVLSLPFLYIAAFKPVLRRLAFRNASRRPKETALVILGALLGTAIITTSAVVGDTLDSSLRGAAFSQLGPVDVMVEAQGIDAGNEVASLLADVEIPKSDGSLRLVRTVAAVAVADRSAVEPQALVTEVDFGLAQEFGDDASSVGLSGSTPQDGQIVLGTDTAAQLDAAVGDQVTLFAFGAERDFVVESILPRVGLAGFAPSSQGSRSPTVFVPLGTIEELSGSSPAANTQVASYYLISGEGGVIDGAKAAPDIIPVVASAIETTGLPVSSIKQDTLDLAAEVGKSFTQLFGAIGSFSVLAGAVLLVMIFLTLAQERKQTLGMLRAVGLRRSSLVGSFSLEGWVYAVLSSLVGVVVGIGIGRVVVVVTKGIFSQGGDFGLDIAFAVDPSSLLTSFAIGFLIALVTSVFTSFGIARLNVIRAIRDLPEPPKKRSMAATVLGAVLLLAGLAFFAGAFASDEANGILAGPAVVALAIRMLLGPSGKGRIAPTVLGAAVVVWNVFAYGAFPDAFATAGINVFVTLGVCLSAGAVAVCGANLDVMGHGLRKLFGSSSVTARIGLAYPLARPGRTTGLLSLYSLVVFTLVFITVLSSLFASQVDGFERDTSGGFDIQVTSNAANPIDPAELKAVPGVGQVASLPLADAEYRAETIKVEDFERTFAFTTSFDPAVVEFGGPKFASCEAGVSDLNDSCNGPEIWNRLETEPGTVVVSEFLLQDGGGPPGAALKVDDKIQLRSPFTGEVRDLTVIGITTAGFSIPVTYVNVESFDEIFGVVPPSLFFVQTDSNDIEQKRVVANDIQAKFLANGAEADPFRDLIEEFLSQQVAFFRLIQGYLALGLIVGIAGLGVVMVRAVRERRRQIGMLRAMGFPASSVRKAFTLESAFVSLLGTLIGTSLALVTVWRLTQSDSFGEGFGFSIPYVELAIVVVGALVASLVATAAPSQSASRIKPAVALRLAD